jgi:hypothetical protein
VRAARLIAALSLALAPGCSAFTPYSTLPQPPPKGVVDPRDRVAICFNKAKTAFDEVAQLAQAECPKGSHADWIDTDYRLDYCPLSLPGRATFACSPIK